MKTTDLQDQKIFWSHACCKSYENSMGPIFLEGSGGHGGTGGSEHVEFLKNFSAILSSI